jgi:hypothetical protein
MEFYGVGKTIYKVGKKYHGPAKKNTLIPLGAIQK